MNGAPSALPEQFRVSARTIDTALRYSAVLRLLRDRWSPSHQVLEVGSGSGGVTEFLMHPVTGVDPAFERTAARSTNWLTPVTGSAEALPFEDDSFDVVLSVDVVEHLAPEARQPALREMVRVLRPSGRLIVTFPSGPTAKRLDTALNRAYRKRLGVDHPWAIEHLQHGVPDGQEVVRELRDSLANSATVELLPHGWAPAWWLQHMSLTVGRFRPFSYLFRVDPAAHSLFLVLRRLNFSPAYRAILVIDKAPR